MLAPEVLTTKCDALPAALVVGASSDPRREAQWANGQPVLLPGRHDSALTDHVQGVLQVEQQRGGVGDGHPLAQHGPARSQFQNVTLAHPGQPQWCCAAGQLHALLESLPGGSVPDGDRLALAKDVAGGECHHPKLLVQVDVDVPARSVLA